MIECCLQIDLPHIGKTQLIHLKDREHCQENIQKRLQKQQDIRLKRYCQFRRKNKEAVHPTSLVNLKVQLFFPTLPT